MGTGSMLRREWPGLAGILIVSAGLAVGLPRALPFLAAVEDRVADLRWVAFKPPAEMRRDIVVVAITEDTFARPEIRYRSPVDRGALATWLEALAAKGARAVAFDLLFDQPTEPEKDRRFAEAVAGAPVPVVVAWGDPDDPDFRLTARQAAFQESYLRGAIRARPVLLKDGAGIVRAIPGPRGTGAPGGARLALAPAIAKALGADPPAGDLRIDYLPRTASGEHPVPVFPAHLVPRLPARFFAGRAVLIGAVLPWEDRHRTPFAAIGGEDATMPGVLIHAQALAQILDGRPGPARPFALDLAVAALLAALGIGLALLPLPLWPKNGLVLASAAASWIGVFALARYGGPVVALVMPTAGLGAAYGLANAQIGRRLRREKRMIRNAFSHYVAPAVVRALEADPSRLALGGEMREVTYVFTDIAGFTGLAEEIPPTRLVAMLNDYLDRMTRIILDHGGTVDKFIGDAVVAMFNAPEAQPDHAERAVRCVLALDACAEDFARRQRAQGLALGHTRIGVHTGTAVVGNFGGRDRFDYTAIGDTVNTAARLEGANKYLGTRICVSGATAALCDGVPLRPIGRLVVKGKTEATTVYEPVDGGRAADGALDAYLAAYALLEEGNPRALDAFRALHGDDPDDTLVAFHVQRLSAGARDATIILTEK